MIEIKRSSLAWRWYQYWVELGGTPRSPENLCRFIRVLLIYAPTRWFFCEKRNGKTRNSPLKWIFFTTAAGALLSFFGYHAWKEPLMTLKVLGGSTGVFAAIVFLIWGSERIDQLRRESKTLAKHYQEARASKLCPYIEVKD